MAFTLKGLDNLGNTCYMNTSLQALFATEEFQRYMISQNRNTGPLHNSLSKLFKDMINSKKDNISPTDFRSKFIEFKPQFKGKEQHDAQEFLKYIIDGIHEEVNEAKKRKKTQTIEPKSAKEAWKLYINYMDDSFLNKLFVGQLSSTIKCTHCNNESVCWDTFWDISLSLPEGDNECTLKECLIGYTADETLDDEDCLPTCSQCNQKRKSIKSLQIIRCPLVLMIQLKKFGNDGQKISKNVIINEMISINLSPYYLYACICHRGSSSFSGHYTVFCKHESKSWHHFDDQTIKTVDNFYSDQLNGAYILFYHMKDVSIIP